MLRLHPLRSLLIGFLLITASVSAQATLPRSSYIEWEWRSELAASPNTPVGFVTLDLPSELFSHLKPDLSDLRIGSGERVVPYVVGVERESSTFASLTARMFNLSSVRGGSTSFSIDLGSSGSLHNSIVIKTSSENFRRTVEIQGSDDQKNWRTLNPRGQIFDYTVRDIKSVAVRDTRVSYPEATYRYLLVNIFDSGEDPLTIQGVEVYRSVASAAREVAYQPALTSTENSQDRATDVVLDLGTGGIPHRRGMLATPNRNFHRALAIYDSDDAESWQFLAHAYIFSIEAPKFTGSNFTFQYPESNKRYLKLSVLNRDDTPIAVNTATLYGVVRRILFSYDPTQGPYYVYAGNPNARRPQYDLEHISQYVDSSGLHQVSALPIEKNPAYILPEPVRPPLTERAPYALPVALGIVVVLLAGLLVRLMRNVQPPVNPPSAR